VALRLTGDRARDAKLGASVIGGATDHEGRTSASLFMAPGGIEIDPD
jgi:hypothetical protein